MEDRAGTPGLQITPLSDGTFIAWRPYDGNYIVRFDKTFHSPFNADGHLFVVDADGLEKALHEAGGYAPDFRQTAVLDYLKSLPWDPAQRRVLSAESPEEKAIARDKTAKPHYPLYPEVWGRVAEPQTGVETAISEAEPWKIPGGEVEFAAFYKSGWNAPTSYTLVDFFSGKQEIISAEALEARRGDPVWRARSMPVIFEKTILADGTRIERVEMFKRSSKEWDCANFRHKYRAIAPDGKVRREVYVLYLRDRAISVGNCRDGAPDSEHRSRIVTSDLGMIPLSDGTFLASRFAPWVARFDGSFHSPFDANGRLVVVDAAELDGRFSELAREGRNGFEEREQVVRDYLKSKGKFLSNDEPH